MEKLDLVGIAEIAEMADISPGGAGNWAARHTDFPEPYADLHMGRVWLKSDIESWLAAHEIRVADRKYRKFQGGVEVRGQANPLPEG